jgi:uncharacterized protein YpmS
MTTIQGREKMNLEKKKTEKINYWRLFRISSFLFSVFTLILVFGAVNPVDLGVTANPAKADILGNMKDQITNIQPGINSYEGIITSEEVTSYVVYNAKDIPFKNIQIKLDDGLIRFSGTLVKPVRVQFLAGFKLEAKNGKPAFDIEEIQLGYLPVPLFAIKKILENNQDYQRLKSGGAYQSDIRIDEIKIEDNKLRFKMFLPVPAN